MTAHTVVVDWEESRNCTKILEICIVWFVALPFVLEYDSSLATTDNGNGVIEETSGEKVRKMRNYTTHGNNDTHLA